MGKPSTTIPGVIKDIRERTGNIDSAVDAASSTPAPTTPPASQHTFDSKKNKQFRKDKKALDSMSTSQIEKLRAKLIAEREAKKAKKITPLP